MRELLSYDDEDHDDSIEELKEKFDYLRTHKPGTISPEYRDWSRVTRLIGNGITARKEYESADHSEDEAKGRYFGTEPIKGPDGKTYYQAPQPESSPAQRKLASYLRDEFVSQSSPEIYHKARAVVGALARSIRGDVSKPSDVSNEDWSQMVEGAQVEHQKAAEQWDSSHPEGGKLYRGLRPDVGPAFLRRNPVGSVIQFGDTTSTASFPGEARRFIAGERDRDGEYMTPGGVSLTFRGVRGSDVFLSSSATPHAFILPTNVKYGVMQMEHEVLLSNARKWRVASITQPDASGYGGAMTLEPADEDVQKASIRREDIDVSRMRKIRDDEGHEHAKDGKFTSGAGGSAAPKIKKPKPEKIDYETVNTYMHPQTGARIPMHHAGGKSSWGGKHSDVAQETFGGQFQRWDEALPSMLDRNAPDAAQTFVALRAHVAQAHSEMSYQIDRLELMMNYGTPLQRANWRQANKALYFDRARAWRMLTTPKVGESIEYLKKTAPLAKMIAERQPKSLDKTIAMYSEACGTDYSLPALSPSEIGREHILYRFGFDVRSNFEHATDPTTISQFSEMFTEGDASVKDLYDFEWAMDKSWGDMGLASQPAAMMLGVGRLKLGQPLGAAAVSGDVLTIATDPAWSSTYSGIKNAEREYIRVVAHEVANCLSHKNFHKEMTQFSSFIRVSIQSVGMKLADERQAEGLSANGYTWTNFMTMHGANMKDTERTVPLEDGVKGDFQEDWAIGLSECVLGFPAKKSNSTTLPMRESVELLCKLFGMEPKKGSTPLSMLKRLPTRGNPFGLPEGMTK